MSGLTKHTRRARAAAIAMMTLAATATYAGVSDLVAFLERAERMYTMQGAVRADVNWSDSDGTSGRCVLYLDPADEGRQLIAEDTSGFRSETPLGWADGGRAIEATGAKPKPVGVDDVLGDCGLRGIDFFPFWKTDYTTAFISDQNHQVKTVSLYASDGRPYKLYVIEFDLAKMVPLSIKFYRDEFNNLVRLRTDSEHVMVGSRPRPKKIVVREFAENRSRTFTLAWTTVDRVPTDFLSGAPATAAAIP